MGEAASHMQHVLETPLGGGMDEWSVLSVRDIMLSLQGKAYVFDKWISLSAGEFESREKVSCGKCVTELRAPNCASSFWSQLLSCKTSEMDR